MFGIRFKTLRTCLIYVGLLYFFASMSDGIVFNVKKVRSATASIMSHADGPTRVPYDFN